MALSFAETTPLAIRRPQQHCPSSPLLGMGLVCLLWQGHLLGTSGISPFWGEYRSVWENIFSSVCGCPAWTLLWTGCSSCLEHALV